MWGNWSENEQKKLGWSENEWKKGGKNVELWTLNVKCQTSEKGREKGKQELMVDRELASYESCTVSLKNIVLDGWMDGWMDWCKNCFKDCSAHCQKWKTGVRFTKLITPLS